MSEEVPDERAKQFERVYLRALAAEAEMFKAQAYALNLEYQIGSSLGEVKGNAVIHMARRMSGSGDHRPFQLETD